MRVTLHAIEQNALLDMLEYALLHAESEIDTNTFDGNKYVIGPDWDPEDLAVWLDHAVTIARKFDAMSEIIENAVLLQHRLSELVGIPENLATYLRAQDDDQAFVKTILAGCAPETKES